MSSCLELFSACHCEYEHSENSYQHFLIGLANFGIQLKSPIGLRVPRGVLSEYGNAIKAVV